MRTHMPVVLDTRVVTGAGGGPEKTILNSPRFLEPAGYRMLCAYMRPPGDPGFAELERRAKALGAPLIAVDDRGPLDLNVPRELLRICRRERVTIWHAHDYKSNLIGLLLRRSWPMRLVTTVHGWAERTARTSAYFAIDRFSLRRYERVLCVSPPLHAECLGWGVPEGRCVLVENGIDAGQFTRLLDAAEAKRRIGLEPDRPVIGAVGRLSAEKGFDLLIRAVDRLLVGGLDASLVIVGEGPQRPELEALVAALGRTDRVHLMGFRADTAEIYEAMDLFALSSLREGLPNAVLEAMAMEVPVVAARIGGLPRLIRHDQDGLLFEPGSVEQLAGALARLLGDDALAGRLRRAARATIGARYSFEARMAKVRAIYDDLLGCDAEAAPAPACAGALP